jgi:hypothetical protein
MIGPRAASVKTQIDFQFVAMPTDILRRDDLSAPAKLLAAVILDSARGSASGRCKLTNASLGARIGRSAVSVKRLLGELEAAGLVRRETIADKHNRVGVVPTGVAQNRSTEQASADQNRPTPGSTSTRPPDQDRPAIQSPGPEPGIQTGSIALDSGGGKTPDQGDRIATPEETATFLRALLRGAKPGGEASDVRGSDAPCAPPSDDQPAERPITQAQPVGRSQAAETRPSQGRMTPERSPRPGGSSPTPRMPTVPGSGGVPDVGRMSYNVAFSARAAAFRPTTPRKTAAQQMAELRDWQASRARE